MLVRHPCIHESSSLGSGDTDKMIKYSRCQLVISAIEKKVGGGSASGWWGLHFQKRSSPMTSLSKRCSHVETCREQCFRLREQ